MTKIFAFATRFVSEEETLIPMSELDCKNTEKEIKSVEVSSSIEIFGISEKVGKAASEIH